METLEVSYYFEDFELYSIECEQNILIKDFIKLVVKTHDERYYHAYLKGEELNKEKQIKDYSDDLQYNSIFLHFFAYDEFYEKDILINLEDFEIRKKIGYCDNYFYEAYRKSDLCHVLINAIPEDKYKINYGCYHDSIYRDIHMFGLMHKLNLPGIIKVVGFRYPLKKSQMKENSNFNGFIFVTEYLKYFKIEEDMKKYLKSNGSGLMNPTIRSKIIFGVASTLKQLHKNDIVCGHSTISNLGLDDNYEVKLTNIFGMKKSGFEFNTRYGMKTPFTVYDAAPEFWDEMQKFVYNLSNDIYVFGNFLFSMFSNILTFSDGKPIKSLYLYVERICKGERLMRQAGIPDHYWDLIEKCWKGNPDERFSFNEIADILEDDLFALEEFGKKTDLEELYDYQIRLNVDPSKKWIKVFRRHKQENQDLQNKLKSYQPLMPKPIEEEKEDTNCFIGEDEEKFFEVVSKIGEGATSITYKVIDTKMNRILCKKILKVDKTTFETLQNAIKEFDVLYHIKHPCICHAIAINTSEKIEDSNIDEKHRKDDLTTVALYLEFLNYNLKDSLVKIELNNTLKTRIVIEIIHAMKFIHKKGLIHRDLKIENIMLNSIFNAKLVDFGFVRIYESLNENYSFVHDSLTKGVGTFDYMSPEMLNEEDYDYKTDVYSFGVVLYFIFIGCLPKQSLKDKISGKMVNLPSPSSSISQCCLDLIEMCLRNKPSERPTFEEILNFVRKNSYKLAPCIEEEIVSRRDQELDFIEK